MSCETSPNAISSPASADGPTPCNSQAGPKTGPSGPVAAPASRSAPQASGRANRTRATCGPSSDASSRAESLQASLANRLRQRLAASGSPEYSLTWKEWVMESGPPICALRASARRTSGNDSGLLPKGHPTPAARDHRSEKSNQHGKNARPLNETALMAFAGTPTPTAMDGERGSRPPRPHDRGIPLSQCFATTGDTDERRLNPHFSRWLMGYPAAWLNCVDWGTQSCRKSRRSSSSRTSKRKG